MDSCLGGTVTLEYTLMHPGPGNHPGLHHAPWTRGASWLTPSFPEIHVELLFLMCVHQSQELVAAVSCGGCMYPGHLRLEGIEPWKHISTVIRVMCLLADGHFCTSLPRHNQRTLARTIVTELCQLHAL